MEMTDKDKSYFRILAWSLYRRPFDWKDVTNTFAAGFELESSAAWRNLGVLLLILDKLKPTKREELKALAEELEQEHSHPDMSELGKILSEGFALDNIEEQCDKCGGRGIVVK